MKQKTTKIVRALLLISFGAVVGSQMIVKFVIAPRADGSTEQGLAVYNLFDHAIPYTFGAIALTIILLLLYLALCYLNSNNDK
jgi:hypothetical protein